MEKVNGPLGTWGCRYSCYVVNGACSLSGQNAAASLGLPHAS